MSAYSYSASRAWHRWRYVRITSRGALIVDPRWYVVTGAWAKAMEALRTWNTDA